jgi:hypothetical protein
MKFYGSTEGTVVPWRNNPSRRETPFERYGVTDNDGDWELPEGDESPSLRRSLRRRQSSGSGGLEAAESARKKARKDSPAWSTRLPRDLPTLLEAKAVVDGRLKGQEYNEGLSLRVVCAALQLQEDWLVEKRKLGQGRSIPPPEST